MERVVYEQMAALDERHWWYRARRKVLADLIARTARPPKDGAILELGCGTGHNLPMLGRFGNIDALELDDEARAIAERRIGRKVMSDPLPELAGVPDRHYDLIAALDVIEHIDDDRAAGDGGHGVHQLPGGLGVGARAGGAAAGDGGHRAEHLLHGGARVQLGRDPRGVARRRDPVRPQRALVEGLEDPLRLNCASCYELPLANELEGAQWTVEGQEVVSRSAV